LASGDGIYVMPKVVGGVSEGGGSYAKSGRSTTPSACPCWGRSSDYRGTRQ